MKIFYHNDADGKCAANVIVRALGHTYTDDKDKYIEMDYEREFPFDIIKKDEPVYILDYSIQPDEMARLLGITKDVVWVDHHKTAIAKYDESSIDVDKIDGIRRDGTAGCELTHEYLVGGEVPEAIKYIGDRDTWTWKYKPLTEYFFSGSEIFELHPLSTDWDILINEPEEVLKNGRVIMSYKAQHNKTYLNAFGYVAEFEGYLADVINVGQVDSKIFDSLRLKNRLQIMYVSIGYSYKVSLRSESIDVSELALRYGGGGHAGAAGLQVDHIPWTYVKPIEQSRKG
jgi:oligoribonuclease NrnB/cAMP/cGMP phosphodiesterase (DHH superfamily)